MQPGERFKNWIDGLAESWKDRLRGWMASWAAKGVEELLDHFEPELVEQARDQITALRDNPATPVELKALLEKASAPTSFAFVPILIGILIATVMSGIVSGLSPAFRKITYQSDKVAESARFDSSAVNRLWLRDKEKYEKLFADLTDQGWSPDRIMDIKELAKLFPPLPDMVRFADYGSFDPKIIEEWREMYDAPGFITEPLATIGITNEKPWEWASKYWFSHWTQPGRFELNDMFRRGLLSGKAYPAGRTMTSEEIEEGKRILKITYLTQGFSSFWQGKLADLVKEVPTRVDVRRFWDMRTIDEARLREIYQARGYFDKDLEDYVLWTKVYVAFPDLLARWSKGWLNLEDVRNELTALGMPAARVEEFIQTKVKKEGPARVEKERDVTKTDIYKGVKQGVISRAEGAELLEELGFDEDEAIYLLDINIPVDEEDQVKKRRELNKGDIKAAVKELILSPGEAETRLIALRYNPADAAFLATIYASQISIDKVEPQRDLTKSDITRALKQGILAPGEVKDMLTGLRYSPEDADLIIATNKPAPEEEEIEKRRAVAKSDIKSAFRTGIITASQAIERLEALEYTPEDAEFLMSLYQTYDELKPITRPREASKADIIAAVKKGLIAGEDAYLMLLDLGFTPEAAEFILAVRAEETSHSAKSYQEFKDLTHKYRVAAGREEKPMTEEIKKAADEVVKLSREVDALTRSIEDERRGLVEGEILPEETTKRLKRLQVTRNRAISKLEGVKSEYDRLVAEWRHGKPE